MEKSENNAIKHKLPRFDQINRNDIFLGAAQKSQCESNSIVNGYLLVAKQWNAFFAWFFRALRCLSQPISTRWTIIIWVNQLHCMLQPNKKKWEEIIQLVFIMQSDQNNRLTWIKLVCARMANIAFLKWYSGSVALPLAVHTIKLSFLRPIFYAPWSQFEFK